MVKDLEPSYVDEFEDAPHWETVSPSILDGLINILRGSHAFLHDTDSLVHQAKLES